MRKYDFAWMLPVCMLAIVVAMGTLLLSAAGLISFFSSEPLVCGVEAEPTSLTAQADSATLAAVVAGANTGDVAVIQAGNTLFVQNCAQCHALNDVVVGPALGGITKRRPLAWIIPWVKNSSKMVANGDEYGVKIFKQYQQQQMPSFQLSAEEIESIVAYIEGGAERS
jgi:mono/diheme cytochrome c family protein